MSTSPVTINRTVILTASECRVPDGAVIVNYQPCSICGNPMRVIDL